TARTGPPGPFVNAENRGLRRSRRKPSASSPSVCSASIQAPKFTRAPEIQRKPVSCLEPAPNRTIVPGSFRAGIAAGFRFVVTNGMRTGACSAVQNRYSVLTQVRGLASTLGVVQPASGPLTRTVGGTVRSGRIDGAPGSGGD